LTASEDCYINNTEEQASMIQRNKPIGSKLACSKDISWVILETMPFSHFDKKSCCNAIV